MKFFYYIGPLVLATWVLSGELPGSQARAYSEPGLFPAAVSRGGGGGRFFTGSPAEGYDCAVCHSGGPAIEPTITGLPVDGYVAGKSYVIEVSWPEITVLQAEAAARGISPQAAINLEIASESSVTGTLSLKSRSSAPPEEVCSAGINKARASELFSIRQDEGLDDDLVRCVSQKPGDRCVVAVRPCGATIARVQWRAPDDFEGPMLFTASMVTSIDSDGRPQGDGASQVIIPIPESGSASGRYEETLQGHCTVLGPALPKQPSRLWLVVICGCAALAWRRQFTVHRGSQR